MGLIDGFVRMNLGCRRHLAVAMSLWLVAAPSAFAAEEPLSLNDAVERAVAESPDVAARDAAEGLVQFMTYDLKEKLQPIGRLELLDEVNRRTRDYQ